MESVRTPHTPAEVARAFAASARTTAALLRDGRLRQPRSDVGRQIVFADGSASWVFRETVLVEPIREPTLLVVGFRLRLVGRSQLLHALFRAESIANTPLFAGFPGFRTKLWLTDQRTGVYRGIYDWDGADAAEAYAQTLTELLQLVCLPGSVVHHVEPDSGRRAFLRDGHATGATPVSERWWRLGGVASRG